jgi:hypothetical protein
MRELTLDEIEQVSGGSGIGEYAADGGGLGSLVGTLSSGTLYGAARGGMVGGYLAPPSVQAIWPARLFTTGYPKSPSRT